MKADPFFDGIAKDGAPGVACFICARPELQAFNDDILRGMAGEGPYAASLSPHTPLESIRRRLADPALMAAKGLPVYPRGDSAFRTHCVDHRSELWANVKIARRR